MNEKNFHYLGQQIKFTGFGEGHHKEPKEKLQKRTPEFALFHQQDIGKDQTVATLQFKKSAETDLYFLNRYSEDNITLKEGYNMLASTLAKHPIKELGNETDRERLITSLERGNRQGVTLQHEGRDQKVFIEAAPPVQITELL